MQRFLDPIKKTQRRGATVALVAVSLVVLLGFTALTIDIGHLYVLRAQLQGVADASALAGASALRGEGDWADASYRARDLITRNQVEGAYLSLADQVIELGTWDKKTRTFSVLVGGDGARADAVRVVTKLTGISHFFAGIMGHLSGDAVTEAIATVRPRCQGIFGFSHAEVTGGGTVGSYDSTQGAYAGGSNGDVCSCQEVSLSGNTEINGDAMAGPGYYVDIEGSNVTVQGEIADDLRCTPKPVVDVSDAMMTNDNGTIGLTDNGRDPFPLGLWHLNITDNLTVLGGTYYFDSVEVSGSGSLTFTGPTTIYIAGTMNMSGSFVFNTSGSPHDLQIFSSGSLVQISGSSGFSGSILAPNATILVSGTGIVSGALIGDDVRISGGALVLVDESLPAYRLLRPPPYLVK